MSVQGLIINQTFGGVKNFMNDCITYAGTPNGNLEIDATAPYGKGVLCWSTTLLTTSYKTDTNSTEWVEID